MSYAIIRNVKHKMSSVGNVSRHNERQNKNYGNPNVDNEKSEHNFHLKEPVMDSYQGEFERIRQDENLTGQIHLSGKKQSNVMCEFMITSNPDFFANKTPEETKKFFEDAYDFVKKKCGEKYIVSAVVHMDEKTPHLHATYIPVVDDKDKKGNPVKKINCSQFWKGYNSYGGLQDDFHKHITSKGYDLERGEVGTQREHLEVADFKRQTLNKEIASLEKNRKEIGQKMIALESKLKSADGVVLSKKRLDKLRAEPGMMGTVKGITMEDIENLKKTALEYHLIGEKLKDLSNKYIDLKKKMPTPEEQTQNARMQIRLDRLEKENIKMKTLLQDMGANAFNLRRKSQEQTHEHG